jgi:putative tricarboxylic transport membrane protein
MESFGLLMGGFSTALQPTNFIFAVMGCFLGTLIGVLPGIGPAAGTAILIPITFVLEPTPAIIMLAAIYYGSMYGGTITSILMNVPGEAATAITCLEGYPMAKAGRAGQALAMQAIASFIGGTVAIMGLVLVALPLTHFALRFGPPEFFCLMLVGLSLVAGLAGKSIVRALMAALFGLLIAMIGIDPVMGAPRFTFGRVEMLDGFGLIPVIMGLFGIGEIFLNAESSVRSVFKSPGFRELLLTRKDWTDSGWPIVRGFTVGFFLGLIPGVGAVVPTFVAYVVEKRASKYPPEKWGTGLIEGVAGPEAANNAYVQAAMIPLFTLGIPGSPTIAILMGAFMMNGLIPGPFLFIEHSVFVWGLIASFYVGNVVLLVMNLPMIPFWVMILKIPYSVLFAIILVFCVVGAYSMNNSTFDIGVMLAFGIVGYLFKKVDIPIAPIALVLILGPLMERGLRQSLEISRGDFTIFFTRPISATLLAIALLVVVSSSIGLFKPVKADTEV